MTLKILPAARPRRDRAKGKLVGARLYRSVIRAFSIRKSSSVRATSVVPSEERRVVEIEALNMEDYKYRMPGDESPGYEPIDVRPTATAWQMCWILLFLPLMPMQLAWILVLEYIRHLQRKGFYIWLVQMILDFVHAKPVQMQRIIDEEAQSLQRQSSQPIDEPFFPESVRDDIDNALSTADTLVPMPASNATQSGKTSPIPLHPLNAMSFRNSSIDTTGGHIASHNVFTVQYGSVSDIRGIIISISIAHIAFVVGTCAIFWGTIWLSKPTPVNEPSPSDEIPRIKDSKKKRKDEKKPEEDKKKQKKDKGWFNDAVIIFVLFLIHAVGSVSYAFFSQLCLVVKLYLLFFRCFFMLFPVLTPSSILHIFVDLYLILSYM